MAAAALRVLVVTPLGRGGRGGIDRMMDELGDQLAHAPRDDVACRFIVSRGQIGAWLSPLHVGGILLALLLSALTRRLDVVHINLSSGGSARRKMLIAWAARRLRIPYLIHLHGSRFRAYWDETDPRTSRRIHAMFAAAAEIVVLGRAWRDEVAARVPNRAEHISILPNATRPAPAPSPSRAREEVVTILFLGRLGARKGSPSLIEALSRLPRDPPWRAVLAGDGDLAATRADVIHRGLRDRVAIPGWVGAAEARNLLRRAAILALPSQAENLPMSVVEAMAHGLAIVTTPVGATPDIIADGETGLLVPPGDVDALTRALKRLLANRPWRDELGAAARAYHGEHLEIGNYVDRLAAIWRRASQPVPPG